MIRVITVDDHPVVRSGLKQIIDTEQDMQIVGEAENAREALHTIRQTDCDAVVLDITLPDASGLEVLNQLKHERPALPILIMSIHEEKLYALRLFKAGASGYLMKNTAPEELIKAIRKITAGEKYISSALADILVSELVAPEVSIHKKLSDREFQIMCLIASGKSLKEIGIILCISDKTVSTYRTRILDKMRLKTNADLVGYALRNKLIE
ncbi:MAG TPA: response regulator transcription factor [Syntrophales bacterium]|mgnify:CR=1 FL=1|nr:response regulator transcription factor [Syntrophales bacterium]HPQ42967.1 response regulator transcription factor [Syntrophales bacterium]